MSANTEISISLFAKIKCFLIIEFQKLTFVMRSQDFDSIFENKE